MEVKKIGLTASALWGVWRSATTVQQSCLYADAAARSVIIHERSMINAIDPADSTVCFTGIEMCFLMRNEIDFCCRQSRDVHMSEMGIMSKRYRSFVRINGDMLRTTMRWVIEIIWLGFCGTITADSKTQKKKIIIYLITDPNQSKMIHFTLLYLTNSDFKP